MRALVKPMLGVVLLSLVAVTLSAQQGRSRFDGAWRIARIEVTSPDSTYRIQPSTGMGLMSGRYFSQIWVRPEAPGIRQASQLTTAEQKAARYDALTANAGTFEVKDTILVFHFDHAKSPTAVATSTTRSFRLIGDTLWLVATEAWEKDPKQSVRTTSVAVRQR